MISVTETWADENNQCLLHIPNRNPYYKSLTGMKDGGVAIFIHEELQFMVKTDLDMFTCDDFEFGCMELIDINNSCINIGVVYQPPDKDMAMFNISYLFIYHLFRTQSTSNEQIENRPQINQTSD